MLVEGCAQTFRPGRLVSKVNYSAIKEAISLVTGQSKQATLSRYLQRTSCGMGQGHQHMICRSSQGDRSERVWAAVGARWHGCACLDILSCLGLACGRHILDAHILPQRYNSQSEIMCHASLAPATDYERLVQAICTACVEDACQTARMCRRKCFLATLQALRARLEDVRRL